MGSLQPHSSPTEDTVFCKPARPGWGPETSSAGEFFPFVKEQSNPSWEQPLDQRPAPLGEFVFNPFRG